MTSGIHHKHPKLARAHTGRYHRNELGLLGAPCEVITAWAELIARSLDPLTTGYLDATHHQEAPSASPFSLNITRESERWTSSSRLVPDIAYVSGDTDVLLINGNHFDSSRQIVFVHPAKKESLARKPGRLTDVRLIILAEGEQEVFSFLPQDQGIPVLRINEEKKILDFLRKELNDIPPINGLVLSGGESRRMGQDKSQLSYHGKPQAAYARELLASVCETTWVSVSGNAPLPDGPAVLRDTFQGLGPYGGILSAFRHQPDRAWLIVACDLPLLDASMLHTLIRHRDPSRVATCFHNPDTGFPEPLLTLWEPRAYPVLLHYLSRGYSCPRKVLINSHVLEVDAGDPVKLMNVNTPQESDRAKQLIHGQD